MALDHLPRTPWDLTLVGQVLPTHGQAKAHCEAEIESIFARQSMDASVLSFLPRHLT
jgi:hypothetical protein